MSWGGMFYDLLIPFILLYHRTRIIGFLLVIFFHIFTVILFPIGMFPYIMIISSLIFFTPKTHKKLLEIVTKPFKKIIHSVREIDTINIKREKFYTPIERGYEREIKKRLQWWDKLRSKNEK